MPILASVEEHIMNIMTNNLFGSWRVTKLPLFWLGRLSLSPASSMSSPVRITLGTQDGLDALDLGPPKKTTP
jgi:hypothetical protein